MDLKQSEDWILWLRTGSSGRFHKRRGISWL